MAIELLVLAVFGSGFLVVGSGFLIVFSVVDVVKDTTSMFDTSSASCCMTDDPIDVYVVDGFISSDWRYDELDRMFDSLVVVETSGKDK